MVCGKENYVMGHINDLEIEDLDQVLAGEVLYMAIEGKYALQINAQSCDCSRVIIDITDESILYLNISMRKKEPRTASKSAANLCR